LIGSNAISVDAVFAAAQQQNFVTTIYNKQLEGEARAVAEQWLLDCKGQMVVGLTQASAQIAGGETTVTITGNGKGGRNQEMALAFALAAEKHALPCEWTFLSAGTDGRDGPTDAAGGIVNRLTLNKIRNAGIDPETALINNDSYTALHAANDLVMTGATGTNVADLQILLLHPFTE
jgi:glycerate 2-kinase